MGNIDVARRPSDHAIDAYVFGWFAGQLAIFHHLAVFAGVGVVDFRRLQIVGGFTQFKASGSQVFSSGLFLIWLSAAHFMAMFQSPSRRTPAISEPLAAWGLFFHSGDPINLSSPREYPVEPITCAM